MQKYLLGGIGMDREIKRDYYLEKLISKKENGVIKVITGLRRVGKFSFRK